MKRVSGPGEQGSKTVRMCSEKCTYEYITCGKHKICCLYMNKMILNRNFERKLVSNFGPLI